MSSNAGDFFNSNIAQAFYKGLSRQLASLMSQGNEPGFLNARVMNLSLGVKPNTFSVNDQLELTTTSPESSTKTNSKSNNKINFKNRNKTNSKKSVASSSQAQVTEPQIKVELRFNVIQKGKAQKRSFYASGKDLKTTMTPKGIFITIANISDHEGKSRWKRILNVSPRGRA